MRVSIALDREATYIPASDYSPPESYPEYPFSTTLLGENCVYPLVRRCLQDIGADAPRFGTKAWNPLGEWIKPGDRVFVLPNFVMHRRQGESAQQFHAKCTHGSALRAVLDYAIIACGDPELVSMGNAPVQACDYALVSRDTGAAALADFYRRITGADVGPFDLRTLATRWTRFGALLQKDLRQPELGIPIDIGRESWLDELFQRDTLPQMRVADYPSSETMSFHGPGKHVYVVNRRLLEADVIISVPKLKTHQKVGITCTLKGTVGAIARKECLAHYRRGSPHADGDEYPKASFVRDLASELADRAASGSTDLFSNLRRMQSKVLTRLLRTGESGIMGGAWHGNNTAWRMALDVARILRYARRDGILAPAPQRQHLSFVDGIVAGEGEGPLSPSARDAGAILFSPDPCAIDVACATLMGYDPRRIPLVLNSFSSRPYCLTESKLNDAQIVINGIVPENNLGYSLRTFAPPKGWVGKIELP